MISSVVAPVGEARHAGGAVALGADLRDARERLGWALEDVAGLLRIRLSYLQAMEQGRFGDLPGRAYALGFVRSYGSLLGLDADELARRVHSEVADMAGRVELAFPAPVPDRGVPAGAVVLLGSLLAIGAYVGWYRMSGEQPGKIVVEKVPDRLARLAEPPPAPLPPPVAPPVVAAVAPPVNPPGLPSYAPISAGAATPPPSFAPPVVNPPAPALPDDTRIVVRARADSWIQVRDKAGQTLINRVLRPGESYNVPPNQQLLLTTGNAGGVDILVDGVAAPSLGGSGVVRRDLPLDPDAIRSGKLSAQRTGNL